MFTLHFHSSFHLSLILLSTSVRYHNRNLLWVTAIYWQSDSSYLLTSFPLITNLSSYYSTFSALQIFLSFSECSPSYWTLIFSSHHVSILLSRNTQSLFRTFYSQITCIPMHKFVGNLIIYFVQFYKTRKNTHNL